jgi:transcriptional regulator with GAF, ATPase, and Fis domain
VIFASGEKSTTLHEHHVFPEALKREHDEPVTLQQATRAFQRRHVLDALEKNNWNVTETARELDLARSHVYNLINDFELRREEEEDKDKGKKEEGTPNGKSKGRT